MMKQQRPDLKSLPSGGGGTSRLPSLAELKALRHAQKETNQRVEELKLRLFHFTEQHMDQDDRLCSCHTGKHFRRHILCGQDLSGLLFLLPLQRPVLLLPFI